MLFGSSFQQQKLQVKWAQVATIVPVVVVVDIIASPKNEKSIEK